VPGKRKRDEKRERARKKKGTGENTRISKVLPSFHF
jgi:hypothetical protein